MLALTRQALIAVLLVAFALLGGRPASVPVTAMPMAVASQICHDDGGAPHQDHKDACLFCHLLGGTGPQEPVLGSTILAIRSAAAQAGEKLTGTSTRW